MSKIKDILVKNALIQTLIKGSKKIVVPWFERMTLYEILDFVMDSFKKAQFGIRSAAISFKFFMALFPTLVFFLSLIPFIPIDNFQENILYQLSNSLPQEIYTLIEDIIQDLINHKHHVVLSIGFFLSMYFASNGVNTLLTTFNSSHQIEMKRNPIKQRLLSVGIFSVISILFIVAFSAIILGEYVAYHNDYKNLDFIIRFGYQLAKWVITIFSILFAISILYNIGNTQRNKWKIFSAGASLATITIILASYGLTYFFVNFGKYNELYGSIGSLLMVLIWINVVSYILLIGFELSTKTDAIRKLND